MAANQPTRAQRRAEATAARRAATKRRNQQAAARTQRAERQTDVDTTTDTVLHRRAGVIACAVSILAILFAISPLGILHPALPAAGDQITHNWWLIEFRDRLFMHGDVFGWSDALSLGYPFGYFYFPFPPLVFSALSVILPDANAIKVMVAASLCILPVAAWRFMQAWTNRPLLLAAAPVAVLLSVFSGQPQLVGGTLASTLTGEFSYAYGLSFSLLAIAATKRALDGRGRWGVVGLWVGVAVLSHIQATLPALAAIGVLCVLHRVRPLVVVRVGLIVAAITSWWVLPLVWMRDEALGDGHRRVMNILPWLFSPKCLPVVALGMIGLVVGWKRRRPGVKLVAALAASGPIVMYLMPGGFLWNVRAMPWTYTMLALAATYLLEPLVERRATTRRAHLALVGAAIVSVVAPLAVPHNFAIATGIHTTQYGGALDTTEHLDALVNTLQKLPPGPAMLAVPPNWMDALPARDWVTALPLYTDGRITSPITLYYEASKSTPGIEYAHSLVSDTAHTSLSWLAYGSTEDFADGVDAMRLLGIRYYLVSDQRMYDLARSLPDKLAQREIVNQGDTREGYQWAVFDVIGSTRVEPLAGPIDVAAPLPDEQARGQAAVNWLEAKIDDPQYPQVLVDGPDVFDGRQTYDPIAVFNPQIDDHRIRFEVDTVGVPVLVRVSYSQRWIADGADGPWRAAPNFMVVVPTENVVELTFDAPAGEILGGWVSLLAAALFAVISLETARRRVRAGRRGD